MKPMLKAPGTKRLTLKSESPLLTFAFNFDLRHYTSARSMVKMEKLFGLIARALGQDVETDPMEMAESIAELVVGRGLHSSTFRLNVSTFCFIRRVHDFPPVY
jgi:hypothetical protein